MFCAFDLETTGLDPQRDQILQIGAVLFTKDGVIDEFETLVRHDRYEGDPFALQMNAALLKKLADGGGTTLSRALADLHDWLSELGVNRPPHPVGFNVGTFDCAFVREGCVESLVRFPFHHRCIELGSVFMQPDGTPGTSKRVVGDLLGKTVAHTAIQDARDAAALYRGRLNGKW